MYMVYVNKMSHYIHCNTWMYTCSVVIDYSVVSFSHYTNTVLLVSLPSQSVYSFSSVLNEKVLLFPPR